VSGAMLLAATKAEEAGGDTKEFVTQIKHSRRIGRQKGPGLSTMASFPSFWHKNVASRPQPVRATDPMMCTMRLARTALAIAFAHLFSTLAYGQQPVEPVQPAAPRVYALIAAIGTQFTLVHEEQTTGTHLSPHRRRTTDALNDALNRIALH